jgi:hypothetical protein
MKTLEGSLRQKKRKRAESEPVLSGNLAMKLEVARSKVALKAEVELKEDALRLLNESKNVNLQMESVQIQDFKEHGRLPRTQAKVTVGDWRHEGLAKEIQ